MLSSISCTRKGGVLTEIHAHDTKRGMGRKKKFHERVHVTLKEGKTAEMDAALADGEDRLDLIREAIERELKRREKGNG